jgi:hypothetical protein
MNTLSPNRLLNEEEKEKLNIASLKRKVKYNNYLFFSK